MGSSAPAVSMLAARRAAISGWHFQSAPVQKKAAVRSLNGYAMRTRTRASLAVKAAMQQRETKAILGKGYKVDRKFGRIQSTLNAPMAEVEIPWERSLSG